MNHTTENLRRIEAVFHEALAVSEDVRSALVDERCGGDVAFSTEVQALLRASKAEETATASRRRQAETSPEASLEPKRVGPYELDRLLGRGGMGAVYLAHRADGHFEQQVAIKLIDLPLATDLFRERFRMERQILAGLHHPFIARLLDGGVSDEGDLYLVMEYVDGIPIHRFCEERQLSIPQRLALFKSVCEAVQFAHQNLVVHRDLKPDNILVAEDGTPRLLDFGTAKLISPSLSEAAGEFTRQGFQSFTPQYASPEQVLGNPITTASDTYSLGVLLYLLLTQALPYELKEFSTEEMVRVICHEPPRRPAQAIGSNRRLDSDLEAILLKALRKEPGKRYLTAEQLASDTQAWLDGQPVGARRGTFRYRAAKFMRRNWLAVAGAAVLVATLLAGLAGVVWQARVANAERRKAEARSSDLRQLSNSLLSELDEAIKQLPGSTGVQKLLITRVLEHMDRMTKDAQGDRQTELDLIDAYTRLGDIQGNSYEQNLGDIPGALVSLGKALAIAQPLAASNPNDQEALQALANVQESRSEVLFWNGTGKLQDALISMQAATATYDRLIALPGATASQVFAAATAYGTLGDELGENGSVGQADLSAALAAYRKTIDLDNRVLALDPNVLRARRGIGLTQMKVGNVELETDPAQALKDFDISLQRFDSLAPADQKSLITVRMRAITVRKRAMALEELGQHSQAVPLFDQTLQTQRQLAAADPKDLRALNDVDRVLEDAASSYEEAANPALGTSAIDQRRDLLSAERFYEQAMPILEQMMLLDPANRDWKASLADVQVRIGTIRQTVHAPGESESLSRRGLAVLKELVEKDPTSLSILDVALRAILAVEPVSLRDQRLAVAWAERGVALSHRKTPAWLLSLARAYRASGEIEKGRAAAKEGLALLPDLQPGAIKPRIRKLLEIESRRAPDSPS
jgi:eukaryotic-like serine/threonine-protein kinase